jgi:PIN domain nuclease of toxin-antitoxin system
MVNSLPSIHNDSSDRIMIVQSLVKPMKRFLVMPPWRSMESG